ncbi:DUF2851 family protein [Kiritimatiellota bacterium B12222]|nr:DUF2851 family protein [Kiritimatiellota bacterium B12222]
MNHTNSFEKAELYQQLRQVHAQGVAEPEPGWDPFSERHLHCIWFDNRLRPEPLETERGEEVRILHPGQWNQESGPDFLDAEWSVGGRRVRGDIEIHIRPMDWKHHGHSGDPRYARVGLHVCYEHGELPEGLLPGACEEVALKPLLDQRSHFFFDSIDLRAYPWQQTGAKSGLRAFFESKTEQECAEMLEAAGQERLRRKALRMSRVIQAVGEEQALYAALMRGLGYKQNADTAESLARCIPISMLKAMSGERPEVAYALLLGSGGLLPPDEVEAGLPLWFSCRKLWDLWWPHQHHFLDRALAAESWHQDHCRSGNHPRLRFRAMAQWVADEISLTQLFLRREGQSEKEWVRGGMKRLMVACPTGKAGDPRLVGPVRAGTLFINAVMPWRICVAPGLPHPELWSCLPDEAFNSKTKRVAHALFGPDQHPRLYRGGLRKQGLLQFHEDFQV